MGINLIASFQLSLPHCKRSIVSILQDMKTVLHYIAGEMGQSWDSNIRFNFAMQGIS